jgi:2-aminoadipate transaminase
MVSNLEQIYSVSIAGMKRSVIRELLKLTQRPEIISFAGGLPSPDSFPVDDLKDIVAEMLDQEGRQALQYGATEGDAKLRKLLVEKYQKEGLKIGVDNLIITTASQQGLDLLGKIFINRGDKVIVSLPSYLGALSAIGSYGAEFVGVPLDKDGMSSAILEEKLSEMKKAGQMPKFIYIIPDFQNPAGITMPLYRRKEILAIAYKYDLLVVEDCPYREIRFEGEHVPTLFELDGSGQVIFLGTFSKTFAPGFRIGWVIANEAIVDKFVVAKQAADLCTPPFVQKIAARYMEKNLFEKNIKKTIAMYKEKRDIMLESFRQHMPKEVTWTEPQGGLFLFMTLPEHMDTEALFPKAIEKNVAYVLGSAFYCNGGGKNTMRLNFSFSSIPDIREGVKRLAEVIREAM